MFTIGSALLTLTSGGLYLINNSYNNQLKNTQKLEEDDLENNDITNRYVNINFKCDHPINDGNFKLLLTNIRKYDIYQKINTSLNISYTEEIFEYRKKSINQVPNLVAQFYSKSQEKTFDAINLLPILNEKYSENYMNTKKLNEDSSMAYNIPINITNEIKVHLKNCPHIGTLNRKYGVLYNPSESYLVIGKFNGKQFINDGGLVIKKNGIMEYEKSSAERTTNFFKYMTFGLTIISIGCGIYELPKLNSNL